MIIILGLIILAAALIAGVAGVLGNGGSAHAVSPFSIFGYHLTGSAGTLFLASIVVGAAGLLGLSLLLAGARRTSRRGSAARRGLRQSRRETAAVSQERDDLIDQRDTARAYTASQPGNGTGPRDAPPGQARSLEQTQGPQALARSRTDRRAIGSARRPDSLRGPRERFQPRRGCHLHGPVTRVPLRPRPPE